MSWLVELEKVYDNTISRKSDEKPEPIYHISNNASVTVTLDESGNFITAELIDSKSKDKITCMPCTESCSSRSSGADAYPLCDKLEYISGEDNEKFEKYINLLKSWGQSAFSNDQIKSICTYVSQKTISSDLLSKGFDTAEIKDFIRWEVETKDFSQSKTWKNEDIQNLWIKFYESDEFSEYVKGNFSKKEELTKRIRKTDLNYANGNNEKIAVYNPAKIRNGGDKAKIISANDTSNYTYRGRFEDDMQACQISSISTQKAHSALRWLIKQQGIRFGDGLTVVTWNSAGQKLPAITQGSVDFDFGFEDDNSEEQIYFTDKEFANAINKRLLGYYGNISNHEKIMIMMLNSATPGRMSILMYRELQNTDLIEALNKWHNNLSWFITYWKKHDINEKATWYHSIGTPSPKQIAECAYGDHVKGNLIEKTVQRIIPCILDGTVIPSDLEIQCVKSASNLMIVDNYNRDFVLETACAVFKYNKLTRYKEEYKLALEETRTSRDYLFGRLLAVAQQLETSALRKMAENRETNAIRYMQQFSIKPSSTWKILYEKKLPAYKRHLDAGLVNWFEKQIQDISALFNADDYLCDRPLSGEYLLGYQCQLKAFRKTNDEESETIEEK